PANVSEADFQDIGSDNELQNPAHTPPKWNDLSTLNCTILWCLRWLAQPPSLAGEQSDWRRVGSAEQGSSSEWRLPTLGNQWFNCILAPRHSNQPGVEKRRRLRPARQGVQPLGACLDRKWRSGQWQHTATAWVRPSAGEPARKPPSLPNRFAPLPKNLQNGHLPYGLGQTRRVTVAIVELR
ncbi:uncharacterized protein PgNI_09331, partial [Pyricularia grisea]|uniref:Uncharacterized protein n=1 Tax=Pyricularia grisea TaxID=148305 RepID=A0A6P8ATW0_PYRGI